MRTEPIKKFRTERDRRRFARRVQFGLALIIAFISVYFFFFKILFF